MLALLLSVLVVPADTVTGRVVDNAGQPVHQAIVEVTELGRSVTTSDAGAFRIALPSGALGLRRRYGRSPSAAGSRDRWRSC